MTKRCPCLLRDNHAGHHSPDLTGMQFHNLRVIGLGKRYIRPTGSPLITWDCQDQLGRLRSRIYVGYLTSGTSQGTQAPRGIGCLTAGGYRRVRSDGRQKLEHRVVMAKIIGRPLRDDEQVHHGPKGRACNDPDNLSLRLKGNHPHGHSVVELADWLRSLGCSVIVPDHIMEKKTS